MWKISWPEFACERVFPLICHPSVHECSVLAGCVCAVCDCAEWVRVGVDIEQTGQHEANRCWQDWRPCSQGKGTR